MNNLVFQRERLVKPKGMLPKMKKNIHFGHHGVAICLSIEKKKTPNPQRRLKSLKHALRVLGELPSNWSPKTAHSLYQVRSGSSPRAGVSTTPLYHPATVKRTWKGKVEAGGKVAKPQCCVKRLNSDMTNTSHALHQECNITRRR